MLKQPRPASATAALFLLIALGAAWLSIGIILALGAHPAMHIAPPWNLLMAVLLGAAGLLAFGLALLLRRPSRLGFYAALAFLAASAVAVIFDQVGWADLMFVAANVIPVILLLKARLWYLRS
jgi:hypothetical protein